MELAAIIGVLVIVVIVLFLVARVLFGPPCAALLSGLIGWCFGGPPGAGAGLLLGLVLALVTSLLLAAPDSE